MTEVRKSGTIYKCRRCLKRPNETYREDPNEVLAICAECGTENWCLPVGKEKGATKTKKVSEPQPPTAAEEVPESIEVAGKAIGESMVEAATVIAEKNTRVQSAAYRGQEEAESVTEAISEEEAEKKRLRARLAELDAEETE